MNAMATTPMQMALLWVHRDESAWQPSPICGDRAPLVGPPAPRGGPVLLRHSASSDRWVLLAPRGSGVHVNGATAPTGIRVLRDRDSIQLVSGRPIYFSTERLARVEPGPGSDRPIFCARCKTEIGVGHPAVSCPQCRAWHHQATDLSCWTYAARCTACDQPTALDAGYRGCPEDL